MTLSSTITGDIDCWIAGAVGVMCDPFTSGWGDDAFDYAEIRWVNYRGSEESGVGVPTDEFRAFPVAPGIFEEGLSPGEFLDTINMPGKRQYPLVIPDKKRNMFVDLEIYSYPLYICKRPEALRRGRIKPAG